MNRQNFVTQLAEWKGAGPGGMRELLEQSALPPTGDVDDHLYAAELLARFDPGWTRLLIELGIEPSADAYDRSRIAAELLNIGVENHQAAAALYWLVVKDPKASVDTRADAFEELLRSCDCDEGLQAWVDDLLAEPDTGPLDRWLAAYLGFLLRPDSAALAGALIRARRASLRGQRAAGGMRLANPKIGAQRGGGPGPTHAGSGEWTAGPPRHAGNRGCVSRSPFRDEDEVARGNGVDRMASVDAL
jgi:hypothetical protein